MIRKALFGTAVPLALLVGLTLLVMPAQADPEYDPACDIDRNGEINIVDIMRVAALWRETGTWSCPCLGAPAPVPKTGAGDIDGYTEQAGEDSLLQKGVAWPDPRFTDNSDGTVTDNLTGLMWMQDANAGNDCQGADTGTETWANALASAAACNVGAGFAGYTDWRLPNVRELFSLIHHGQANSATWLNTQGFTGVQSGYYWSSTTRADSTSAAWIVVLSYGSVGNVGKSLASYVWPVRGGQ